MGANNDPNPKANLVKAVAAYLARPPCGGMNDFVA